MQTTTRTTRRMLWQERQGATVSAVAPRPWRMSRGPAALPWAVVIFILGQALLLSAFYGWLPEARDPEYGGKLRRLQALIAAKPNAPLVVVLGSSRVAMGFRPDSIAGLHDADGREPVVFNYSLVGSGPILQLFCLRRLLDDGIKPDWVLVEYWPAFYDQQADRAEEMRLDVHRLAYRDFAVFDSYSRQPELLHRNWWQAQMLPAYAHRFILLSAYAPAWLPWTARLDNNWAQLDDYGWLRWVTSVDAAKPGERLRRAREYYEPILKRLRQSELSERAVRELAATCLDHDIRWALLYMPEARVFTELYPPEILAATNGYVCEIADEFVVPLCDARTWVADEDFIDGFHLLPEGAKTFSERFGREVLQSLLDGRPPTAQRPPCPASVRESSARRER